MSRRVDLTTYTYSILSETSDLLLGYQEYHQTEFSKWALNTHRKFSTKPKSSGYNNELKKLLISDENIV